MTVFVFLIWRTEHFTCRIDSFFFVLFFFSCTYVTLAYRLSCHSERLFFLYCVTRSTIKTGKVQFYRYQDCASRKEKNNSFFFFLEKGEKKSNCVCPFLRASTLHYYTAIFVLSFLSFTCEQIDGRIHSFISIVSCMQSATRNFDYYQVTHLRRAFRPPIRRGRGRWGIGRERKGATNSQRGSEIWAIYVRRVAPLNPLH